MLPPSELPITRNSGLYCSVHLFLMQFLEQLAMWEFVLVLAEKILEAINLPAGIAEKSSFVPGPDSPDSSAGHLFEWNCHKECVYSLCSPKLICKKRFCFLWNFPCCSYNRTLFPFSARRWLTCWLLHRDIFINDAIIIIVVIDLSYSTVIPNYTQWW